ncbi:lipid A biosynthesis acyltransferase [Chitinophaga pendula]|uniref:LpxL/LpxP family acyltransferase n=1 Tax=Chitinophaga TaxID=79328 RepID=UPI000BAF1121|nr:MULTISPECIES: lipid A biosynthesis acyltransferase [Chitinophaga]ASZ11458.1 lipid A biosynthesis acyltransferase [Chitinophaga sp. MD30]UCJ05532.1 lipid A biosynthesis acyltransferase [Chitinophaga pendula]
MPSWQGKSKGNKLGYSIFIAILRYGGVYPAYILLRFVAGYYFLFSYSSSRPIYHYFRTRIGYSPLRSLRSVYRNYYVFGQTLLDKIVVMADMENKFSFHFDGEEHLRSIVSSGKGGILLSAHLGNWEVAGHLFRRLQAPINIVMFDGEHERIKKYLSGVTGGRHVNIIVLKDDLSHIYAIHEALSNKELVCMHADRFLPGNKTITAPFLGAAARFPAGPFILAAAFKVPVSLVFAFKESATHYHLYATSPKTYQRQPKDGSAGADVQHFITEMEQKVKQYPEQWFNYYDFWDMPEGPTTDAINIHNK